jgi:hypothetical protein
MAIPLFLRHKKSGVIYLNELKRHVKPYWLVPQDLGNAQGQIAIGALGVGNVIFVPDQNGPFEGFYFTCDHGGAMTVRINDTGFKRDLMNRDVHIDTIMSPVPGGQFPFVLPESLWLEQRHALMMTFTDLSNVAQTVRPVIHGRKFFLKEASAGLASKFLAKRQMQQRISTPYFYTTDAAVQLAAAAIGTRAQMTISEEGHFVAYKITCVSTGPFDFIVRDGRTGQSLSGATVVANTTGTGTVFFPYVLPEPMFIERNTQLIWEFNNRFAGGLNNIWLTVSGRRVYDETFREIV